VTVLFKRNKQLEAQIDEYLDLIVTGGLLFRQGLKLFLQGRPEEFDERLQDLRAIESKADALRRGVESELYLHTLIPESRGDVLGLLERADQVLNMLTSTLQHFAVEAPDTLADLREVVIDLADNAVASADAMVRGVRAYFRDLAAVRDHISQAQFYRAEANRLSEKYRRDVFRRDLRLSHKIHLRYFAEHIERIAEEAEDVCDRLAIAAIKRHQ
jgi:predicted phosphate transport protein (TIGR00153 family)